MYSNTIYFILFFFKFIYSFKYININNLIYVLNYCKTLIYMYVCMCGKLYMVFSLDEK